MSSSNVLRVRSFRRRVRLRLLHSHRVRVLCGTGRVRVSERVRMRIREGHSRVLKDRRPIGRRVRRRQRGRSRVERVRAPHLMHHHLRLRRLPSRGVHEVLDRGHRTAGPSRVRCDHLRERGAPLRHFALQLGVLLLVHVLQNLG